MTYWKLCEGRRIGRVDEISRGLEGVLIALVSQEEEELILHQRPADAGTRVKFLIKKLFAGGSKRLEILMRVRSLVAESAEGRAMVIVGSGLRDDGDGFIVAEAVFGVVAVAVH